ncbi:hypothetical protein K437DRAFT_108746 [Tilletiaria anomala UBC 951]|uniref:Urea transporter n=1 Tax=Tilletiaria anomala (strain ATCC 24038 / CBS 436.72 / UBC 951) TaxID=1037660 RepID=A0A066W161_TILAU|nr:uncharacterized protein K437DRAFT_108746 [Tilletiaria anomala UBC 951]KDN46278.1 hypothetical protein K437DRAFT_108746 [Tilletiaria anomala UBC 951]
MSSSLLFGYPQLAVIPNAGILGLAAYSFATIAPLWVFAFLGPQIRKLAPEGFTLSQYIRVRFGWPLGVLAAVVFVGFMLCFMIVELNTYGSVVSLLGGVNPTIAALTVAITTTIYTAYGGFKASLWTDNVNAIIISIFIILAAIATGVKIKIDPSRIESSGLLKPQRLGGELWYILTVAIVFSQMFNQGFWQRAFASKNDRTLYWSVGLATVPLFAICFLVGMTGPLAWWSGLFDGPTAEDDGSQTFFYVLATLPKLVQGVILVLAGALSSSAYDTLQSAQISTIENDVLLGRANIWICRAILICLNIPAVVLAVKNVNILQVFLVADVLAVAILPPVFLGLIPQLWFLDGFDAFIGAAGGFFSIFLAGLMIYGNADEAGALITLPQGLYIDDNSVLAVFFAAPIGSIVFTFVAFLARAGAMWAFCRFTGHEYTVFHKRHFDTSAFALPEDRPAGFHSIHGTGSPDDRRKLSDEDSKGAAEVETATETEIESKRH